MEERYRFFAPVHIRYADTDAQGHVYFANHLTYFDMARLEYFKAVGYPYKRLLDEGIDFFEAEALCRYRSPAYFDETLHVHTRIGPIGNTSFTASFTVFEPETDRLVCTGHLVGVMVDKKTGDPVSVPQGFRQAVRDFEGELEGPHPPQ